MDFKTAYDPHDRVFSISGKGIKDVMAPELDRYGNRVIKKQGEVDLYAQIQSWRDECDINILMAKFTNGDRTALMQRVGEYLDLSLVPDNFNDMLNMTTKAKDVFNSLPVEIKEVFGNNVNNFLANSQTKEFAEILSKSPEQLRLEKLAKSNEQLKKNLDAGAPFYAKQPSVDDIVIEPDPGKPSLLEEVQNTVYGKVKLNEQK